MRLSPLLVGLLAVGCAAPTAPKPASEGRPQPIAKAKPPVAGVWVSPKKQTANDWQVALLPDGGMTVSGPGLRGHGRYKVEDKVAVGTYEEVNGEEPVDESESKVRFELDPDSKELTFQTGIPGDEDVPVRLVPQDEE
ncbi:MAG: hypothetical protein ACO1SV_02740 [Fimbriimonas sp.]